MRGSRLGHWVMIIGRSGRTASTMSDNAPRTRSDSATARWPAGQPRAPRWARRQQVRALRFLYAGAGGRWPGRYWRAAAPEGETSASWPMLPPGRAATMGQMEIRIILDRAEPPVGRPRAVPDPGHRHAGQDEEIRFTGWLGLLRALYEVTGGPGAGSVPVP